MRYYELSPTIRRRSKAAVCPLCNKHITSVENIEYVHFQNGRFRNYVFFHTECLRASQERRRYGEEIETEQGTVTD